MEVDYLFALIFLIIYSLIYVIMSVFAIVTVVGWFFVGPILIVIHIIFLIILQIMIYRRERAIAIEKLKESLE